MFDTDDIATHSEEVTQEQSAHPEADAQQQSMKDAYAAFGLEYQQEEPADEPQDDHPPIDETPEDEQPKRGITVKHNKEEVFIDEEKIPEYARKGLNYEKVEGRAKQYQEALDRIAKQQGFKDHNELVENLDKLEQQAIQRQQDQFNSFKQQMREEAENAGLDPDAVEQYLDNHPMLNQAREVLERDSQAQTLRQQEEQQQRQLRGWEDLFHKYPKLAEETSEDGSAPWMTKDMQERIRRGYDPIDAYELVHRDSIMAEERKKSEQSVLKQQRLNKRAPIDAQASSAEPEPEVPEELATTFAMFEIPIGNAKKYAKSFKSGR